MYKLFKDPYGKDAQAVCRLSDGACIPFEPANTDYQRFKSDLVNGMELKDADGNVMTLEQITGFLESLP